MFRFADQARRAALRNEIGVATKAIAPWRKAPNTGGLSRKALLQAIDDSLVRLGMDFDLLQIHRFDHETHVEETMEALHDIVKSGKARYIGASSMEAWRFAKMQQVAKEHGSPASYRCIRRSTLSTARKSVR